MSALFVYSGSDRRTFWGYVFHGGKPTEVRDRATIERLRKDKAFTEVSHEAKVEERPTPAPASPVLSKYDCPKCRREFRRGLIWHMRGCKA